MGQTRKLIFVYNAKSGFMHSVADLMHKTVNPKTYPCKLCSLTYNGAFMNKLWRRYVAGLGIPAIFMHNDEFSKAYPNQHVYFPVIFLRSGSSFKTLISREDFKNIKDLGGLMKELTAKLEETVPAKQYQCSECGLNYEDEEIAKKCEAWCSKTKSCNLEITQFAVENKKTEPEGSANA